MASTCPDCHRPFSIERPATTSITGRRICRSCDERILAAGAGMIANPGAPVAGAVSTVGWFRRLRDRRKT